MIHLSVAIAVAQRLRIEQLQTMPVCLFASQPAKALPCRVMPNIYRLNADENVSNCDSTDRKWCDLLNEKMRK